MHATLANIGAVAAVLRVVTHGFGAGRARPGRTWQRKVGAAPEQLRRRQAVYQMHSSYRGVHWRTVAAVERLMMAELCWKRWLRIYRRYVGR